MRIQSTKIALFIVREGRHSQNMDVGCNGMSPKEKEGRSIIITGLLNTVLQPWFFSC